MDMNYEYPCMVTKGDCLRMEVLDGELTLSFHSEKFGIPGSDPTVKMPLSQAGFPLGSLRDALRKHMRPSEELSAPVGAELVRDELSVRLYSDDPVTGPSPDRTMCIVEFLRGYRASPPEVFLDAENMWRWVSDMACVIRGFRRESLTREVKIEEKPECPPSKQNMSSSSSNTAGALGCSALSSESMVGMAFQIE